MTGMKLAGMALGGWLVAAGMVGILESGAADVFLEATRPDFQKISLGVLSIQNGSGPEWLGGRLEEVLKKDVKRSLYLSWAICPSGIKVRDRHGVGNGRREFQQSQKTAIGLCGEKRR